MKTGHLLYLGQINREAFNTLRRRGYLAFLDKHSGEKKNRFNEAHALAVAVLRHLQVLGLKVPEASEAVNDSWPDIMRVAGLSPEEPKSLRCGARINHLGIRDTWGWPHPQSRDGQEPLGDIGVNLRTAWEWLQPSLREIDGQPDSESDD